MHSFDHGRQPGPKSGLIILIGHVVIEKTAKKACKLRCMRRSVEKAER